MKHTFIYPRHKAQIERAFSLIDSPHKVEVKPYRESRSLEQNSLMCVWFNELSIEYQNSYGEWISQEGWHQFFIKKYLTVGVIQVKDEIVKQQTTTSRLTIEEFSDFLTNIDQFCAESLQILLTHPAEYHKAMGHE